MAEPGISAALHNCSLHALTPELKLQIQSLAENPERTPEAFQGAYDLLKNTFAEYYHLDASTFSWTDFHELLSRHNAFDTQLVLGPALRQMVGHMMQDSTKYEKVYLLALGENLRPEAYVRRSTKVLLNGVYPCLSYEDVFHFLAEPLGFNLIVQRVYGPKDTPEGPQHLPHNPEELRAQPLGTIHVYFEGNGKSVGHFERTMHNDAERINHAEHPSTQLLPYLPFFNQTKQASDLGLEFLKQHVQLTHAQIKGANTHEASAELLLTLAQITKFNSNMRYISKTWSERLLGPNLTPQAKDYIEQVIDSPNRTYSLNFIRLLRHNYLLSQGKTPRRKAPPKPEQALADLVEQLLEPAVSPVLCPHDPNTIRQLSAQQIAALHTRQAGQVSTLFEYFLSVPDLSQAVYDTCNKIDVIEHLSDDMLYVIENDKNFEDKASETLKRRVHCLDNFETLQEVIDASYEALDTLKKYAIGVPAQDLIQAIEDVCTDLSEHTPLSLFQQAGNIKHSLEDTAHKLKTLESMQMTHFEGQDQDDMIRLIRKVLNAITCFFTLGQISERNYLAEAMGYSFFFRRETTDVEAKDMTKQFNTLKEAHEDLTETVNTLRPEFQVALAQ